MFLIKSKKRFPEVWIFFQEHSVYKEKEKAVHHKQMLKILLKVKNTVRMHRLYLHAHSSPKYNGVNTRKYIQPRQHN